MKKIYEQLVNQVIDKIGGKDNIDYFTHCVTRLRFNLKDQSLASVSDLEKLAGVLGVQWQNDQLQIIIGQDVNDVYQSICQKYGLVDNNIELNNYHKNKFNLMSLLNNVLDSISGSLSPSIPALIGCGMIQVLLIIAGYCGLDANNSTYKLLYYAGQAGFYFLPIIVCGNAAKKFGANQGLGMVVGGMLILPEFITQLNEGLNFMGIPVYNVSYASTIFPAILCAFVMAPIEKFFAKYSVSILRSIMEPLMTLLIMVPLAYCLLGPLGAYLGNYISSAIIWLYSVLGFVGVAVLAMIMPFLIMTGMHSAFVPYLLQMFATVKYEPIFFPALVISNINQGVASLAVAIKTKNSSLKSLAFSCSITAVVGGVTEPAMYGVNLKFKRAMLGAMIGSFMAGLFAGLFHVYIYAFAGASSIVALPCFIGSSGNNMLLMLIAIIIGILVTFVSTLILYKDE